MTQPATHSSTSIQAAPADTIPPAKAAGLNFGWRVALTLWAAAFLGLVAFELLNTLVRSIGRMF